MNNIISFLKAMTTMTESANRKKVEEGCRWREHWSCNPGRA